ncbi:hypothetical protein TEQG_00885 [Trichophyton equinum CBS 127.97]|uniref:Uncharacterized protein n=1 Tax=Trichophyton equinum (strain ATCC MYA-4606 / CBS 127.97) TaxID=559882 RepID=F2PIX6_TRIEC|nr:hypothetical protein TEQG_00885 [Trichophyton equinum CBS 127.97]
MSNARTPPPSYGESAQTPAPPPLGRPELSPLTLDGNLIYPVVPPTTALYELTHEVDAGYRKIGISRLCPNRNTAQHGNTDDLIFRIRPRHSPEKQETLQWEDANQSLVAIETVCIPGGSNVRPVFHIVCDMDDRLIDALITAWCAKIWIGHQLAAAAMRDPEGDMGASRTLGV